jgi:DNA-directed RNA polymerase specialized sigma24 family protein
MQSAAIAEESGDLNRLLEDYLHGRINRKEMEGKLFMYIRNHPRRFSISMLKSDTRDDFISWLYPRLSRALDHYVDKGSCFDAYITTMVRLSVKEYSLRKKDHRIIEKTWWDAKAQEMAVMEEESEYLEMNPATKKVSNPRQVLMLLLKSYYYLSDDLLERIAPALGLGKEELFHMVDRLRIIRVRREESINSLKERIHCQFYRCLSFEKRMQAASYHSAHWFKMKRCLETAQKRLGSMRKRFNAMRIEASNEQVAGILGVKKGTIDSNLFEIRKNNQTKFL